MNRVRPWLWIGRYRDTLAAEPLVARGVGAVLEMAEATTLGLGLRVLYLPVEDAVPLQPGMLARGLEFVAGARRDDLSVLIACGAGMSRSVVFSAAAVARAEGLELDAAMDDIRRLHPRSLPHPVLWRSVCAQFRELPPR